MAGIIYRFPTNVSMTEVTQEYVVEREKLLGLQIAPFEPHMTQRVQWDELDSERGMTAPHNMESDPKIDRRPGSKLREYEAIPFKQTDVITEKELLRARQFGTLGGVVDLHDIVGRTMKARVDKTYLRAEWCIWQALMGELEIEENNVYVHEFFPVQVYNVVVDWDEFGTATPLRDFNAVKLLFRGTGASGKEATAYMNSTTINWLLENTNASDIQGFKGENFANLQFSLEDLNKILKKRGLPQIEEYDGGYIDEAGDYQTFIPDGEVVVIGKRPAAQKVMTFAMTPSLHLEKNGQPVPGFFSILEVNGHGNPGVLEVSSAELGAGKNPRLEITGGVYGGPRMPYPRSIVRMRVKLT